MQILTLADLKLAIADIECALGTDDVNVGIVQQGEARMGPFIELTFNPDDGDTIYAVLESETTSRLHTKQVW